ncbi:cytochrome b [Aestuariibius sp. 2305UL40-4]|uniref:cytochrome b n=1 Tax=Aestuariibius violaceus TaxID=3234132 RepID=UPI00345EC4FC
MALTNTSDRYGALTKFFHWLIVALFAWQYFSGNVMTGMERGSLVAGIGQNAYFNWHKSIGLVALGIAIFRIINRSIGQLPNWAPTLGNGEKVFIHRAEQVLYLAMFVMPISGYIYVMAGDYGVLLFGEWKLPNPIGKIEALANGAKWVHIVAGYVLAAAVLGHVLLVLRHQIFMRDGLLWRMLPSQRK